MAQFYYRDPHAPPPNTADRLGVVAILVHEGRLLLDHRSDRDVWAFIGGALESNESVSEAIVREVYEETGYRLTMMSFFGIFSDPSRRIAYDDRTVARIVTIAFRAEAPDPSTMRLSRESRALRLFSPSEASVLPIAATHRPILEEYLRRGDGIVID